MTLLSVPVIDIAPYRVGRGAAKDAVVAAVDTACRDIGFLVITGHGVSPALIARVEATSRRFFKLPLDAKQSLKRPKDDQVRGYSAVGNEGLSYSLGKKAPGDLKESFSIGPIDPPRNRSALRAQPLAVAGRRFSRKLVGVFRGDVGARGNPHAHLRARAQTARAFLR